MAQNPFEAPRVEAGISLAPAGRFEVMRAIGDSWHAVIGDLGVVIIASAIFWSSAMASLVTVLGFFLFFPVMVHGGFKMLLNLQDKIAGYTDLGEGFPRYWSVLGDTIVLMLLLTLLWVPFAVLATVGSMIETRALAAGLDLTGLAVTAALAPRFVFAPFYLVEQNVSPMEAMRLSWAATAEQKLAVVFLVFASMIVAAIGGACGIGIMISGPMAWVMYASAFRQMHPKAKK